MFPIPTGLPASEWNALQQRILQLEKAFDASLDVIQLLVQRLDVAPGSGSSGELSKQLQSTESDDSLREKIAGIGQLVKIGEASRAARQFRDAFHCTWDHAHQTVRHWNKTSADEKLRAARLATFLTCWQKPESDGT